MQVVLILQGPRPIWDSDKNDSRFLQKLFSISEDLLDPLAAAFGPQVKSFCTVSMFSNKKTRVYLMTGQSILTSDLESITIEI